MPRPMTLPSPWNQLATKLGGVAALAKAFGTVPRTVNDWVHGNRVPRGPAWLLIQKVFREHGLQPPERSSSVKERTGIDPKRFLEEVAAGLSEYRAVFESRAGDAPPFAAQIRVSDALARAEAAGIAIERAAYAAALSLTQEGEGEAIQEAQSRCKALLATLGEPMDVLLTRLSHETGPGDSLMAHAIQSLQSHRAEALGALREVGNQLIPGRRGAD